MNAKKFMFGAMPASDSTSGQLNAIDWQKTGRMLVVVVAGAVATSVVSFLSQWLTGADLGQYQPIIMMFATPLLELARRYVAQHFPPTE